MVLVQEGIMEQPNWRTWVWRYTRLMPRPLATTAVFGMTQRYEKFCVASEGYRRQFLAAGMPASKLVVTGIPNFDDFARFRDNDFPHRGYVLVCTSDGRETMMAVDRPALLKRSVQIAAGRQLVFKLHPNENVERASREILEIAPTALVYADGNAEEMVANCDVLITEHSSLTFCGLALGKEVHTNLPLEQVAALTPVQNRRAAEEIADVIRGVLRAHGRVASEVGRGRAADRVLTERDKPMGIEDFKNGTGQRLYVRAKQILPGGAQLLGKRAEMYLPELWPAYYARASGCEVWDLDGRRYLDFTMVGIGASTLGYADPDVEKAVIDAVKSGPMCTLNPPEDVGLAELLLELHPWADMVSYARSGGEVMAKAVRIARAATGRDEIAFCGYHGWHDWYLSVNLGGGDGLQGHLLPGLEPNGVPKGLAGTDPPLRLRRPRRAPEDRRGARQQARRHRHGAGARRGPHPGLPRGRAGDRQQERLGAPLRRDHRRLPDEHRRRAPGLRHRAGHGDLRQGALQRLRHGGHRRASKSVMEAVQKTFISSAYFTERVGPAAALASTTKHRRIDAGKTLTEIGTRVQEGWKKAAERTGVPLTVTGIPALASFGIQDKDAPALMTLFIQEMLGRGFLASDRFYPTVRHEEQHVSAYLDAVEGAFGRIADARAKGDVRSRLLGPVKHTGFARLA